MLFKRFIALIVYHLAEFVSLLCLYSVLFVINVYDLLLRAQGRFTLKVRIPRIKRGEKQELETLISQEAMLLGKFLREERKDWNPRIAIP